MPIEENDIQLGATYRDVVTGFTGIAMILTKHLTACTTVGLEGTLPEGTSGRLEYYHFDITRLEFVKSRTQEVQQMIDALNPPKPQKQAAVKGATRSVDPHEGERR